jgi:hypothetical protein
MPNIIKISILLGLMASTIAAQAEFKNKSYSYFAIGSEQTKYSESLNEFVGTTFKSDFSSSGLSQSSGGYTAMSEDGVLGFFIATSSTLLADEAIEEWNVTNPFNKPTTVQTDHMSINQAGLDLIAAYHFKNGFFVTAGMHYQKITFSRFNFESTGDTATFSTYAVENSDDFKTLTAWIADNTANQGLIDSAGNQITTIERLQTLKAFAPELETPVVFENITTFSGIAGVGYDSFFMDRTQGMRYKFNLAIGTPMYLHVLNTKGGGRDRSLSESLPGGIDVNANAAIGYQFNDKISVMASLSYNYADRNKLPGVSASLPDNTFEAITPELAFFWAF